MAFVQLDNLWVSELGDGVAAMVIDVPGSKNNSLGKAFLGDLDRAMDDIDRAGRFRLLIVRSGKERHFASGPGIEELANLSRPEDFAALAEKGQQVFDRLQGLNVPSVAVIAGSCLGGGLELALACDYRVVVDTPSSRLGFTAAELGLMPGWGGTQRLPRIVGLERSLQMLLGDRHLSAQQARQWGLADALAAKEDDEPPAFLAEAHKRPPGPLPGHTWRQWIFEGFRPGRWLIFRGTRSLLRRKLPDDVPVPWQILEAVQHGIDHGIVAGLAQERTAFARVSQGNAFRNLLHIQQEIQRIRRDHAEGPRKFRRIGVVGAGARGLQILVLAVMRGCHVVVREADESSLGTALYQMLSMFLPAVQSGILTEAEFHKSVAAIKGTTAWKDYQDLDLIVECVGPNGEKRAALYREMQDETGDALLLTATGDQTLEELRTSLDQPERLAGAHFSLPVSRGSVVEVVGPPAVETNVASAVSAWAVHLGCIPVTVRDAPGMLVRRLQLSAILEAMQLLQESIPPERIDEAMRKFGLVRGPLEQADSIGLPRLENLAATLGESFPERFPHERLLSMMIEQGWLGHRTGLGFYRYGKRSAQPNADLHALLREMAGFKVDSEPITPQEQRDRCRERIVARTVNEAAWCLEEGIVADAGTLDLAMALTGWAPHRGGPLTHARQQGIAAVIAALTQLAERYGPRFRPCPALARLQLAS